MNVSLAAHSPETLIADAIARIEERRNALDRLADKGMEMVERLAAGEGVEIAGRKPFEDPARAFVVISRAVRFCVALASRLDEALVALLRGGPVPDLAILAPTASAAKASADKSASPPAIEAPTLSTHPRARIARAVDAVIEAEAGDDEDAERLREYLHEHLTEGEDYDALLHQPWRSVVEAICADLGLHPSWGEWDNVVGFEASPSRLGGGSGRAQRSPGWGIEGDEPTGGGDPHFPTPLGQGPGRPSP